MEAPGLVRTVMSSAVFVCGAPATEASVSEGDHDRSLLASGAGWLEEGKTRSKRFMGEVVPGSAGVKERRARQAAAGSSSMHGDTFSITRVMSLTSRNRQLFSRGSGPEMMNQRFRGFRFDGNFFARLGSGSAAGITAVIPKTSPKSMPARAAARASSTVVGAVR